jgi:hypothetical protein
VESEKSQKKRISNITKADSDLNQYADQNKLSRTKRHLVVPCGLQYSIHNNFKMLLDKNKTELDKQKLLLKFQTNADDIGIIRTFVALFSNYMILQHLKQNTDIPKIDKTFSDRIGSSSDAVRSGNIRKVAVYVDVFQKFINELKVDISKLPESNQI